MIKKKLNKEATDNLATFKHFKTADFFFIYKSNKTFDLKEKKKKLTD